MKQKLLLLVFLVTLLGMFTSINAQTYLAAESFEGTWTGTPAAPTGWAQIQVTAGSGSGSNIAWEKSTYSGSWSPAGNGTKPTSVPNGSAVAHYNDYNAQAGQVDRLYYSTTINLTSATIPRVQFSYFYSSGSASLQVVGSNDGGITWGNIGSAIGSTGASWSVKSVSIPAQYFVANFMVGFQVTAAWGSHDLWLDSFTVNEGVYPLTGTKTINPSGSGSSNYLTLTAAINALNEAGIGVGGVTFDVKDDAVFTEECPIITATGTSGNPIIFQRDNSGTNRPVIKPTTSTAGIQIAGGDYITFNGIDIMVNSGSTPNYGYYIYSAAATNGAQYNTIKNCKITLNKTNTSTKGIYQYYNVTPTSVAGVNSYNKYQNITVENSTSGIYCYGYSSASYPDVNTEISGCTLGGAAADNMGGAASSYGVYAYYQSGLQLFNNEIRNFTTSYSYGSCYGIYLSSCYGINSIYANKVHDIKNSVSTTYAQYGIYASLGSTLTNAANIYNNMIWNISSAYTGTGSTSYLVYGMYLSGSSSTNTYNVDFNSIRVVGPATAYSAGVYFAANTAYNNLRNNIIANYTGAQTTYKHVGTYYSNATTIGAAGSVANRNIIYIDNATNGILVRGSSTDYTTLAAWTTASTHDANSKISNPQFTSATNLYIQTEVATPVESNGSFFGGNIGWVQYDIDGNRTVRNDPPDIGADEGDFQVEIDCVSPEAQPTDLVLIPGSITINGSFTASDGDSYLVVRHTEPNHSETPQNGTWYSGGNTLGNGTVVSAGSAISFIASGLTAETEYFFTIYAYNASGLNAPKYLTDAPLVGSMITLPAAPGNPTSFTAVAINSGQINLTAAANVNNDNVIVAWNSSATFGNPLATGYSTGDAIVGGGTVLYMGPASALANHSGLTAMTNYYYKVWSYISAERATYYVYSGGLTASSKTWAPTIASFPYSQGFENAGAMPADWSVTAGSGATRNWECVTTDTYGASAPHSGTYFSRLYVFLASTSYNPYCLVSPPIDLSAGDKQMNFWVWIGSTGASQPLDVEISTNGQVSWELLYSYNNTSNTNQWYNNVLNLSSYTSNAAFIRFKATSNYGSGTCDLGLDDIVIEQIPSSPLLSVTPASKDFGTVNLNTTSTAQVFTIKNVGGGTLTIDPAVALSGDDADQFELTDANSYPCALDANESITVSVVFAPTTEGLKSAKLKIVDDLAKNLTEVILSGTGFDATIDMFPYSEGFDADTFPPVGWSNYSIDKTTHAHVETGYWSRKTTGTYNSTAGAAFINYSYSSARYACLQMPVVNIPASHRLSFYWRDNDSKVAAHDTTYCEISTDGGTSWTLLATLSPETTQSTYQKVDVGLNPYAGNGRLIRFRDATDASYSAWGTYLDEIAIQEGYDYPAGEPVVIGGETITVTGGSANNGTGEIPPVNNASFVTESSYVLQLIGTGPWTITIETTAPWGAYYQGGQWNSVQNIGGFITFIINGGKDAEIPVVLGDSDPTLPVELSSFTATITTDLCVKIAWIAQSETNHSGYNILRAEANDLTNAIKINPTLIDNGTPLGTQISYSYTDVEAYSNMVYYYWLESIALDGVSEYFGPLSITIGDPSQPPLPPAIPMFTKLLNAFPNPFNPNTNLRYSLKEAGKVNISIYNVKGQLIKSFQNDHATPGYYQVSWDGRDMNGQPVSSGIYMYRMTSGKYSEAKKMILAK